MSHPGTLIIRTRQRRPVLELFFHSLWSTVSDGTKIVVVDDGSEYSVRTLVSQLRPTHAGHCEVVIVEHENSRGSASCLNEALNHVEGGRGLYSGYGRPPFGRLAGRLAEEP